MKIILKIFSFCFVFLTIFLNNNDLAFGTGNVDWILLKENNEGKQWLDMARIKTISDQELNVLTKFYKNPKDTIDKGQLSLYVMRINCNDNKFKDISVNGIPQFNSKWQTSNNDELIDVVIEKSCSELKN